MLLSSPASETRPVLADFACLNCHGTAVRVVSLADRYVYLRCDDCGEVSTMRERRSVWRNWLPGSPAPLKARLRRVTDLRDAPADSPRRSTL